MFVQALSKNTRAHTGARRQVMVLGRLVESFMVVAQLGVLAITKCSHQSLGGRRGPDDGPKQLRA